MNPLRGGCWPSPTEELLLRAALLKGDDAVASWHEWKKRVGNEEVPYNSYRLFPQLYKNLKDLDVEASELKKLKEAYISIWYQNEHLFKQAFAVLRSFNDADIPSMVLKGGALAVFYYQDNGLRRMADLDLLVPRKRTAQAAHLLIQHGWTPQWLPSIKFDERYLYARNSHPFRHSSGAEIDLHWHMLFGCRYPGADDDFWQGAIQKRMGEAATCILNPSDQLLHVCVHGTMSPKPAHLEWIADAAAVIRTSSNTIDYDRIVSQAKKHALVAPVRDALNYIKGLLALPVPDKALQALQKTHVSNFDRIKFRILARPRGALFYFIYYSEYSNRIGTKGLWERMTGFPSFLKLVWHLNSLREIPKVIFEGYKRKILKQ